MKKKIIIISYSQLIKLSTIFYIFRTTQIYSKTTTKLTLEQLPFISPDWWGWRHWDWPWQRPCGHTALYADDVAPAAVRPSKDAATREPRPTDNAATVAVRPSRCASNRQWRHGGRVHPTVRRRPGDGGMRWQCFFYVPTQWPWSNLFVFPDPHLTISIFSPLIVIILKLAQISNICAIRPFSRKKYLFFRSNNRIHVTK